MTNEKKMDCVILGLLSHESLTGYEIRKRMDTAPVTKDKLRYETLLKVFFGGETGSDVTLMLISSAF